MSETLEPDVATSTPPPLPPVPATTATGPTATGTRASAGLRCANCGGATQYTPGTTQTTCIQCGSQFPIETGGAVGEEHDLAAGLADPRATENGNNSAPAGHADELSQEFVCPSCQGAVGFVGTLTATRCPFCAHPVQSGDVRTAPDRFPVDGIVPFGLDQPAAEKHVRTWISKRRWAPSAFKKYAATGSFAGIYLPFFTFDAHTVTDYRGYQGTTRTRTVRDSKGNSRTESYIDWDAVSGTVTRTLDDVPVTAESSVDAERMRELEPWPTESATGFRSEYLAGFLARRYDRSLAHCQIDARTRMDELIDSAIEADIGGEHQRISSKDTDWSSETFRHLMLPVFLLVVTFRAKPYQVAVNGVTGEVHGKRPWSWVKIGSAVLAAIIAVASYGIWAWQHEGSTTDTPTSPLGRTVSAPVLPDIPAPAYRIEDRPAVLAGCTQAIVDYRTATPDTYFPAVGDCTLLGEIDRNRLGGDVFEEEQISAARVLIQQAADGTSREQCVAAYALYWAQVKGPGEEVTQPDEACAKQIESGTYSEIADAYQDVYEREQAAALAGAP